MRRFGMKLPVWAILAAGLFFFPATIRAQGQFWMPQPQGTQHIITTERGEPVLVDEEGGRQTQMLVVQATEQDWFVLVNLTSNLEEPILVRFDDLKLSGTGKLAPGTGSSIPLSENEILSMYDQAKLPMIDYRAPAVAVPPGPPPLLFGSGFIQGFIQGQYIKAQKDFAKALAMRADSEAFNAKVKELNEERRKYNETLDQQKKTVREASEKVGWTDFVATKGKTISKIALFDAPKLKGAAALRVCLNPKDLGEICGEFKPLDKQRREPSEETPSTRP